MAFKKVLSLDAEITVALGGRDKKTGKANPTKVEGYYLGSRQVTGGKKGPSIIHFFQTPKGNLAVWGKTDSNRKLAGVAPGTMTRVSFDKMKPTPNGDMYCYNVEVDEDNTIDVSELAPSQEASSNEEETEESEDNELSDAVEDSLDNDEEEAAEEEELAAARPIAAANRQSNAEKIRALLSKNKK